MADTNDAVAVPTAEEMAAARQTLNRGAAIQADAGNAAMISLVTSEPFADVFDMMIEAQALNRGNGQLAYAITMFDSLRTTFAPR